MNTTIKGLTPNMTLRAFHLARAQPFLQYREQPPGAPLASGTTDAQGSVTIDLPERTPLALVRPDGTAIVVNNATTVVTSA